MIAFRVTVPPADEDVATALLYEAGTTGIEVLPGPAGAVALLAYFPVKGPAADLEEALRPLPAARVEPAPVPEVDWVARFRATFRGFAAGRFRIAPPWDLPADRARVIVVDPGRAFGTGTHETTRLCLAALEDRAGRRPLGRVLDLGTGTGILAVAARRLGASAVVAADLDPEATESAHRHARLNDVELAVVRANGGAAFPSRAFDVVLANLSAPLLQARVSELVAPARSGGTLILSGMLALDVADVKAAYAQAASLTPRMDGEWACLVGERR